MVVNESLPHTVKSKLLLNLLDLCGMHHPKCAGGIRNCFATKYFFQLNYVELWIESAENKRCICTTHGQNVNHCKISSHSNVLQVSVKPICGKAAIRKLKKSGHQSCQICLGMYNIPKRGKCNKTPQKYQNDHKIYQMFIKTPNGHKIYQNFLLQGMPKHIKIGILEN
jgi:hypothetical protein